MTETPNTVAATADNQSLMSEYQRFAALDAQLFEINKGALLAALATAGITHVVVTFDGCGDSGQVEDIEVKARDNISTFPSTVVEFLDAVWGENEPRRSTVSLKEATERLTYDVLSQVRSGWENNDGAYGEVVFDVAENTITLDFNERYTAIESHNYNF
ncbi:DUF6878 family protein [Nitrospirillum amazonense]|uniref:DUF6878 family protein n=1 Tax=Nitrospirillum amazonense TaxID=28077 RepID=UPI00241235FE|nr:DUF6878 family protein [Nitrospirillum amazonense]MDG3444577.1 hypothetical protein [Nitrospirillum amazonense]